MAAQAGLHGPQKAELLPHITQASISCRRAFAPLVDAGFLEVVYGGAEQGAFLVNHPTVKSIHLTGSAATYDAIVWGPGEPKVTPGAAHCPLCVVAALRQNAQRRAELMSAPLQSHGLPDARMHGERLVGAGTSVSCLCQVPPTAAALLQLCPSWHRGLPPSPARAVPPLISYPALLLQTGTPALTKPVAAELGCVTPCIVVPGRWTQRDLEYHADNIVSAKSHNCGHNCLAAEVIITAKDWPQREAFLDALRWGPCSEPGTCICLLLHGRPTSCCFCELLHRA